MAGACLSCNYGMSWLAKRDHKGSPVPGRAGTNHVVVLVNFIVN